MSLACQNILVHFSGSVQGVGFRYTTSRIARGYASVTGYVKNLPDGRVEMFAEATSAEIDAFLESISSYMAGFIREKQVARGAGPRHYNSFGITY